MDNRRNIHKHYNSSVIFLDFFRALLIVSSAINNPTPEKIGLCKEYHDFLARHLSTNMFTIAFRSSLSCLFPKSRIDRLEDTRRCIQSVLDNCRNSSYAMDSNQREMGNDVWQDFAHHLSYITNRINKPLAPPLIVNTPLHYAWIKSKVILLKNDETWNIWIEWYEYRFLNKPGSHIPNFLWKEIEDILSLNSEFLSELDSIKVNGIFARTALACLERLVDHQANSDQIHAGIEFSIVEDQLITQIHDGIISEDHISVSAVHEVVSFTEAMLDECAKNSANYLVGTIQRYRDNFGDGESWSDSIQLIMRGDAVRRAFEGQIARSYDSDLPELSDESLLVFRNLVRAHNFLVSLHPDLNEIDQAARSVPKSDKDRPYEGLNRIIEFADTHEYLEDQTRQTVILLKSKLENSSNRDFLIMATTFNFVKMAGTWVWNNKGKIAKGAGAVGTGLVISRWMVANEIWLLQTFSVDSSIGALVRAAINILKGLPIA